MDEVGDEDDYSRLLLHNFRRIGELAGENARVLDNILMPILNGKEPLDEGTSEELDALNSLLLSSDHSDKLDSCLADMINDRLNVTAEEQPDEELTEEIGDGDPDKRAYSLMRNIDTAYEHMARSFRSGEQEEFNKAIEKGGDYYRELLDLLSKDKYALLSPKTREQLVSTVRFGACLYEPVDPERMLLLLNEVRNILSDPFYRELPANIDWDEHEFVVYEYISEMCYLESIPASVCEASFKAACECERMMKDGRAGEFGEKIGFNHIKSVALTAASRIMDPSLEARLNEAIELYEKRDKSDYSMSGTNANLGDATIIFRTIDLLRKKKGGTVSEKMLALQRRIPYEIMRYYSLARSAGMTLSFDCHLNNLFSDFKEVPGGIRCDELCMRALVAIHPPTYVHSNMVAHLSLCFGRHLLATEPECFIGFPGCGSAEEVEASRDRILDYIWYAALYLDIGKLTIMDIISMYGRRLMDTEYLMLKKHPDNGADMADSFVSLKEYSDVIRGHHLWYDTSAGYPMDFKAAESPYKTVIDIVMVADCMDAATDRVGRSYSRGKTLEEFVNEVDESAGRRYAPYMAKLLPDPGTVADIRYLLDEGRQQIYRSTFRTLMDLFRRGRKEK